jgi:hypothetical protein
MWDMTKTDLVSDSLPAHVARRHKRAARERARALSPIRFMLHILALPGLATVIALSLYVRTSPYPPDMALRHLIARTGCDSARSVGLAEALRGEPGYHSSHDADGDGVACRDGQAGRSEPRAETTRIVGGAKFVRP